MNNNQREMMLHALGGSLKKGGRNYYCADVDGPDDAEWKELVDLGLARQRGTINEGRARYYLVTPAGVEALQAEGKLWALIYLSKQKISGFMSVRLVDSCKAQLFTRQDGHKLDGKPTTRNPLRRNPVLLGPGCMPQFRIHVAMAGRRCMSAMWL